MRVTWSSQYFKQIIKRELGQLNTIIFVDNNALSLKNVDNCIIVVMEVENHQDSMRYGVIKTPCQHVLLNRMLLMVSTKSTKTCMESVCTREHLQQLKNTLDRFCLIANLACGR